MEKDNKNYKVLYLILGSMVLFVTAFLIEKYVVSSGPEYQKWLYNPETYTSPWKHAVYILFMGGAFLLIISFISSVNKLEKSRASGERHFLLQIFVSSIRILFLLAFVGALVLVLFSEAGSSVQQIGIQIFISSVIIIVSSSKKIQNFFKTKK